MGFHATAGNRLTPAHTSGAYNRQLSGYSHAGYEGEVTQIETEPLPVSEADQRAHLVMTYATTKGARNGSLPWRPATEIDPKLTGEVLHIARGFKVLVTKVKAQWCGFIIPPNGEAHLVTEFAPKQFAPQVIRQECKDATLNRLARLGFELSR